MASLLADHEIPTRQITSPRSSERAVGLYLHIPFCHAKCNFCDFAAFVGQESKMGKYLDALETEMSLYSGASLSTLFIGGGTPTTLSSSQIDRLFSSIRKYFDVSSLGEASVEANPESSSLEILSAFKRNGVNRISFGLQATQQSLLESLGRQHTYSQFLSTFVLARQVGFKNINVDLMFGLPGQMAQDWAETLNKIADLSPEHISAYALKIEEGTKFKKQAVLPDEDQEADFYRTASEILSQAGYAHYEISNFAKPGFESTHNLKYWKNEETLGIGVSSASYFRGRRFKNTSNLIAYMRFLSENKSAVEEEYELDAMEKEKERIMLALRLKEGVPTQELPILPNNMFDQFLKQGYARKEGGHYHLTPEGWLVSNQLFQHLV